MRRKLLHAWIVMLLAWASMLPASASITYTVAPQGNDVYTYSYDVINEWAATVDEFSIFFDPVLFADLQLASSPMGWDALVIQPDRLLPSDGYVDLLALSSGLGTGESLTGLSVTFTFLGQGVPGAQAYHIVDPVTFEIRISGRTENLSAPPTTVDAPTSAALLLAGLAAFAAMPIRKRRAAQFD